MGRALGGVALGVHAAAHLAVYPVTSANLGGLDGERFWNPPSLATDAGGWAARVLLVVAAASYLLAAGALAVSLRTPARRLAMLGEARWEVLALVGSVASITGVLLLWSDLQPRPATLWVGPVVSSVVLVVVLVLAVRRTGRPPHGQMDHSRKEP